MLPRQFLQVSVLRPYFPGSLLNNFSPTLGRLVADLTSSKQRLHPGLPGYLIRFAPQGFVPHRQTRSVGRLRHWWSPQDYRISPLPQEYLQPLPVSSLAVYPVFVWLSHTIYPSIYQTGYGRFRPNNNDHYSGCRYYRGGWHPSYPALTLTVF